MQKGVSILDTNPTVDLHLSQLSAPGLVVYFHLSICPLCKCNNSKKYLITYLNSQYTYKMWKKVICEVLFYGRLSTRNIPSIIMVCVLHLVFLLQSITPKYYFYIIVKRLLASFETNLYTFRYQMTAKQELFHFDCPCAQVI